MVTKPLYYLFIMLLLTCFHQTMSQNNEGDKMIGFTLSPLIPIDYFGAGPLLLENNFSNIELSSKIGYQFGMLMRNTKSKNITLESGILFCRRNFKFKGENIKDTLMDMAIYSLITMILYEEEEEKHDESS